MIEKIYIEDLPIQLGKLLKLINLAQDGFEAKHMITSGLINVNGSVCTQRGKKIYQGDTISLKKDKVFRIDSK